MINFRKKWKSPPYKAWSIMLPCLNIVLMLCLCVVKFGRISCCTSSYLEHLGISIYHDLPIDPLICSNNVEDLWYSFCFEYIVDIFLSENKLKKRDFFALNNNRFFYWTLFIILFVSSTRSSLRNDAVIMFQLGFFDIYIQTN